MVNVHSGSWFNLPDLGLTERLSNYFGQGRTAQGGSNMFGDQSQTVLVPSSGQSTTGGPNFVPTGGSGAYGITQTPAKVNGGWYNGVQYWENGAPSTGGSQQTTNNNPTTQQQSTGPTPEQIAQEEARKQEELNRAIDAIYGPQYNSLTSTEANLNSQLQPALDQLAGQKKTLLAGVDLSQTQGNELVQNQLGTIEANKQSAFEQAVANYNVAKQATNARWGRGSSANAAISELVAQQYAKNLGGTEATSAKNIGELMLKQRQNLEFLNQKRLEIDDAIFEEENRIRQDLKDKLLSISMAKNTLEANKSQQKLDALKESIARTNKLAEDKQIAEINLELYKKQVAIQLQAEAGKLQDTDYGIWKNNTSTVGDTNNKTAYNPNTFLTGQLASNNYDDPNESLINPFLA